MSSRLALLVFSLAVACSAQAGSFRTYHPDQYYFGLAMQAHQARRYGESLARFRQAARYADKPAQLALAIMARDGVGREADLAEAYAWADLASERGYREFLVQRERIWANLDAAGRTRALALGAQLYAEYGDAVAKPRLERLLHIGLAQKTGTRTGAQSVSTGVVDMGDPSVRAAFVSAFMTRMQDGPGGAMRAFSFAIGAAGGTGPGSSGYYDDANWRPEQYWATRDAIWMRGSVEVKPLEKVDDAQPHRG
ncbi:MAG TPA: hypothetical protein VFL14_14295 [Xanthomonadales bacterium]|nr:hypothetical protein [Xanthomonadales bacterium]